MSINVTVGRLETGNDLILDLTSPGHLAIQGQSRSGKSVLTYGLLAGVAHRQDVVVAGVDPTGILLRCWSDHPRPEWRALGGQDVPGMADTLDRLVAEMDERIHWLADNDLEKLGTPSPEKPLVLIVLEEWPGVGALARADDQANARKPTDRVSTRIAAAVGRLVKEGAKSNIRLIVLAQRMSSNAIDTDDRANFAALVSLKMNDRHGVEMLFTGLPPETIEQVTRFQPGMLLIQRPEHGPLIGKADLLEYSSYVSHVRSWAGAK